MLAGISAGISRRLLAVAVCCVAGCRATPSESPITSTRTTTLRATTRAGRWETFRVAEGKDLRAILITSPNPAGHYPTCVVQVYNASEEDVVVSYEPGSVVVHCGPYELHGPPATFVSRREVLRPNQPIEFSLPAAGWSRSPTNEPRELLIPTELPAGTYPVWATFRAGSQDGQTIETAHYTFTVP
jgi:hypothetical protein